MEAIELAAELQSVQRGRGLGRSGVRGWAGPLLLEQLNLPPEAEDAALREHLSALLIDASANLPRDLRFLFLVSVGINSDAPLLKDRLAKAAQVLDRDPRTLSRRLRQAELLVASNIVARSEAAASPFETRGWLPTSASSSFDLSGPPVVVTRHVLRALREQRTHQLVVSIPATASHREQPIATGLDGCTVTEVRRLDDFTWQVTLALPGVVRWGQQCALGCRFEFGTRDRLSPYALMAPIASVASWDLRVDLGEPRAARRLWLLNRVPAPLVHEDHSGITELNPAADRVVEHRFENLDRGFAYGMRWEWAD